MVTPPNYPTLGKTELAYAVAAHLVGDYPDGQILLELAGASPTPFSPALVLQQVIRLFRPEDKLPEELPALEKLYRSVIAGRRVLILADDARDAAQVRPLLPPPGCALLVTSRQRFTLDGMIPLDLERLEEDAGVTLLRSICPRLTEDQAQQIARLCGYLPLALRVSAGILLNDPALSPERYLTRLAAQPLAELRDPDDPARDVGAILRLSYATLEASAQAVFRRLGMLAADADLALIATVLELSEDQAGEVLRTLLRRSLVEYDEVRQRWGLHDLVRACALDLLVEVGEERVTRLRYAEQVIALIEQADRHYQVGGDGVLEGLALFDRERVHLEAIRTWLWAQQPAEDIDRLVIQEAHASLLAGGLRDPLRTVRVPQLERALRVAQRRGDRAGESITLGHLGLAYKDLGKMWRAIELYEQWLAIAHELGDRAGEGRALGSLGIAYYHLGEARRAIELHEQDLVIARELGDRRGEGQTLGNLGNAYKDLGEVRRAIAFYEQALAIARELGDWRSEGQTLGNLGNAYHKLGLTYHNLGAMRRAITLYEQDLVIARELGDRRSEGITLGNLGSAYSDLGDVQRAITLYEQVLVITRELDDRRSEGQTLTSLGLAYHNLGAIRRAITLYEQVLAIARELGERQGESMTLGNLGNAYADLGEARWAIELYEQHLVIARELGDRRSEGITLGNLGSVYAELRQPVEADACYVQSLAILDELGDQRGVARTRWAYGQFLIQQGDRERGLVELDVWVAYEQQFGHPQAAEHAAFVERLRADGAQPE